MQGDDGFHELDRQECLRLLAGVPIGRVVYTHKALPAVLPVNFSLDHDYSVLLRTPAGSRLASAVDGSVVAFEADEFDEAEHTGWSVVVTGVATHVTDPEERHRLHRTGPRPWRPMRDGVFIRIEPELVTGRRLTMVKHVIAQANGDAETADHTELSDGAEGTGDERTAPADVL